jgi:predicted glycoside hydrolase/deacetylase ChbG (UPF0249 family)
MEAAAHGAALLGHYDICLGQHTNICVGRPVTDPERIPSLVNEDGFFKSSGVYRQTVEDFVSLEEVVLEIEAQYARFREMTGREPDYFEGHAVRSTNYIKGLEIVAARHRLRYSSLALPGEQMTIGGQSVHRCFFNNMTSDYDAIHTLRCAVESASEDMPNVYVCHPGYVDAYLLQYSSLTVNRTKDTEMLCSPEVKQWLTLQDVQLLRYNMIG